MLAAHPETFDLEAELIFIGAGDRFNWGVSRSSKHTQQGDSFAFRQRGEDEGINALDKIVEKSYARDGAAWTDGTKGVCANDRRSRHCDRRSRLSSSRCGFVIPRQTGIALRRGHNDTFESPDL